MRFWLSVIPLFFIAVLEMIFIPRLVGIFLPFSLWFFVLAFLWLGTGEALAFSLAAGFLFGAFRPEFDGFALLFFMVTGILILAGRHFFDGEGILRDIAGLILGLAAIELVPSLYLVALGLPNRLGYVSLSGILAVLAEDFLWHSLFVLVSSAAIVLFKERQEAHRVSYIGQ